MGNKRTERERNGKEKSAALRHLIARGGFDLCIFQMGLKTDCHSHLFTGAVDRSMLLPMSMLVMWLVLLLLMMISEEGTGQ